MFHIADSWARRWSTETGLMLPIFSLARHETLGRLYYLKVQPGQSHQLVSALTLFQRMSIDVSGTYETYIHRSTPLDTPQACPTLSLLMEVRHASVTFSEAAALCKNVVVAPSILMHAACDSEPRLGLHQDLKPSLPVIALCQVLMELRMTGIVFTPDSRYRMITAGLSRNQSEFQMLQSADFLQAAAKMCTSGHGTVSYEHSLTFLRVFFPDIQIVKKDLNRYRVEYSLPDTHVPVDHPGHVSLWMKGKNDAVNYVNTLACTLALRYFCSTIGMTDDFLLYDGFMYCHLDADFILTPHGYVFERARGVCLHEAYAIFAHIPYYEFECRVNHLYVAVSARSLRADVPFSVVPPDYATYSGGVTDFRGALVNRRTCDTLTAPRYIANGRESSGLISCIWRCDDANARFMRTIYHRFVLTKQANAHIGHFVPPIITSIMGFMSSRNLVNKVTKSLCDDLDNFLTLFLCHSHARHVSLLACEGVTGIFCDDCFPRMDLVLRDEVRRSFALTLVASHPDWPSFVLSL